MTTPAYPVNRYRPTRAQDGEGGWTETLGTPAVIYGAIVVHQNETSILVDMYEDVLMDDVIGATVEGDNSEARYRITGSTRLAGSKYRKLTLVRIDRPIQP